MDDLLQRAIDHRERLRAELEAVERFIASYAPLKEKPPEIRSTDLFSAQAPERKSKAEHRAMVQAMMIDAAIMMLDAGRPLTRSELVDRLEAAGYELEGADKSKVLGTNLWRSKKFINIKGVGYWPKRTPIPAAYASRERRKSMLD